MLSSMGAANKLDPMAFKVSDIEKTSVCPLAKVIRIQCRKRGIRHLKVVYSEEPALPPLDSGDASHRPPPASNAFVPAACGLLCGSEAVKDLLRAGGAYRGQ